MVNEDYGFDYDLISKDPIDALHDADIYVQTPDLREPIQVRLIMSSGTSHEDLKMFLSSTEARITPNFGTISGLSRFRNVALVAFPHTVDDVCCPDLRSALLVFTFVLM